MNNPTAILSMLHEGPRRNSATRLFRGEPVLHWTLRRLARSTKLGSVAVLCWEDQLDKVTPETGSAFVLAKGPRTALHQVDAVAAARRWSDGWRGGLLSTCDFDLGFHGPWFSELASKVNTDAVLLVDPASALVDPAVLDGLIAHAEAHPATDMFFVPAAPGLGGALLRTPLLERLARAGSHSGKLLHYLPDQTCREPLAGDMCAPAPLQAARTTHRFKLDSDRQISRLSGAMVSLNGHLISSGAVELVEKVHEWNRVDPLPREIVLELTTERNSKPIWWPGSHYAIRRDAMRTETAELLFEELSAIDDTRLTLAGVGDPALADNLFEIIESAHQLAHLSIHVETDLLNLPKDTIRQLANSPVDVVSVHLPAMSEQTYSQVMGVSGYDKVIEAIRLFAESRSGRSVPILVPTFTKCRQNLGEMEAWYDQWLRAVGCAVIRGPGDCGGLIPDVSAADMAPPRRRYCSRLNSRMTILSDKTIVSCEEDALGRQALGLLGARPLREIWQQNFEELRADHRSMNFSRRSICANCREWHRP